MSWFGSSTAQVAVSGVGEHDVPEPPEEDDSLKPKDYALNPIQAAR